MRRLRFTDEEIRGILAQQETGKTVSQIAKESGISEATFYNWKVRFQGGSKKVDLVKTLERENTELKALCMDVLLRTRAFSNIAKGYFDHITK